ncbi:MAG: NTE family protein [Saprospiraceae bacterium]|jgi:NTE family protein
MLLENQENQPKVGITFSGGGTRAVAQIGVIKALREHGIEAVSVAGTSGGSIVAALYAAGLTNDEMLEFIKDSNIFKLYKPGIPINGLTSLSYLGEMLAKSIPEDSFESLYMPCHIVASNLMTGKPHVFNTGKLFQAITASCSVPLVFKPVEIDGQIYADGGIFDNMPVESLKQECDVIIGINVMPNVEVPKEDVESMISIGMRVFDLMIYNTTQKNFSDCHVVIQPSEVYKYNIFNFSHFDEFFQFGYDAAMAQMDEVKRVLLESTC